MGANCSCLSDATKLPANMEPGRTRHGVSAEAGGEAHEITSVDLNEKGLLSAQSAVRGYAARKKVGTLQTTAGNDHWGHIEELSHIDILLTEKAKQTLKSVGEFVHKNDHNDGVEVRKRGPVRMENNAIYEGEWSKDGKRHGKGKQYWVDGSLYEGNWVYDKTNGQGRLIHADGDMYEGQWLDDKAHGKGIYRHFDGAIYEGEWKNDKQHGKGKETWTDGAVYEGQYKDGKKNGKGVFKWADGSKYTGEFVDNNIQGQGKYVWNDGRVFEGHWADNKMHGHGEFKWPDGRLYIGEYIEDKKQGYGEFHWPEGKVYKGQWFDGKQHGEGELIHKGVARKGIWENGKKVQWTDESSKKKA